MVCRFPSEADCPEGPAGAPAILPAARRMLCALVQGPHTRGPSLPAGCREYIGSKIGSHKLHWKVYDREVLKPVAQGL